MGIVDKTRGNVVAGDVAYFGSHKITWGSAAPTTGYWGAGDICFSTTPTASTSTDMGWVCVTTGEPGTWEPWGDIGT